MPATYQTDGAINAAQGGNDIGGTCTGIGFGSNFSTQNASGNFSAMSADLPAASIGNGATSVSADNTGNMVVDATVAAGSGYTNGVYLINSDNSGGQPAGAAQVEVTVSGGALTAVRVTRAGARFSSAPTFNLANALNTVTGTVGMGAGTGGSVTATVATQSRMYALGAAVGSKKGLQSKVSAATIANGATGAGLTPYINRSGRQIASGDTVTATAP